MVNVLEKMIKQQDTVFYSRYFVDEYNMLCYHINGLFFMHGLPRSKVFCSGYAVPGVTFRRRPFINRKTSKIKRRFLVSFFVVKNSRIQAKGANTMERSYWIIQKKYKHIGGRTWNRKLWNTKEVCAKKNSF